jgi:hypothetical protein
MDERMRELTSIKETRIKATIVETTTSYEYRRNIMMAAIVLGALLVIGLGITISRSSMTTPWNQTRYARFRVA